MSPQRVCWTPPIGAENVNSIGLWPWSCCPFGRSSGCTPTHGLLQWDGRVLSGEGNLGLVPQTPYFGLIPNKPNRRLRCPIPPQKST